MFMFRELKRAISRLAEPSAVFGVSALGISMALTAAMLSILHGTLLRGMPLPEPERLVAVERGAPDGQASVSYDLVRAWSERSTTLEHVAAWFETFAVLSGDGRPAERYLGAYVGQAFFPATMTPPALGRALGPEEQRVGVQLTIVLSHRLWGTRFGFDEGVVGSTISVGGEPALILGVMPEGFAFPRQQDFWLPLGSLLPAAEAGSIPLQVLGRLAAGRTVEAAQKELDAIAKLLPGQKDAGDGAPTTTRVRALIDALTKANGSPLWWMTAAAFGVLLIGGFNVANLLVARQAARRKDGAIRWSLGGTGWSMVRPSVAEGFLFAALGGVVGVGLAQLLIKAYNSTGGLIEAFWVDVSISPFVLLAVVAMVLTTTVFASVVPSLFIERDRDVALLREQSRGALGAGVGARTSWTLAIQIMLSCSLLFATLMMVRSVSNVESIDFGDDPDRIWSTQIILDTALFEGWQSWLTVIHGLSTRLHELPGVSQVAFASSLPTEPTRKMAFQKDGQEPMAADELPVARWSVVSPGFFSTFGRPLLRGRDFELSDSIGSAPVVIVNREMAERYFPNVDPVGQRIQLQDPQFGKLWFTIVGVCPNLYLNQDWASSQIGESVDPGFYLPLTQHPRPGGHLVLRTKTSSADLAAEVRRLLAEYSPDMPALNPQILSARIKGLTEQRRMIASVFGLFGFAAILLTACGIFAFVSFLAAQKKASIALRIALGASKRHVISAVCGWVGVYLVIGLLASVAAGYWLSELLSSLLYGTGGLGTEDFVIVLALVAIVSMIAVFFPVRDSLRLQPAEVLREE